MPILSGHQISNSPGNGKSLGFFYDSPVNSLTAPPSIVAPLSQVPCPLIISHRYSSLRLTSSCTGVFFFLFGIMMFFDRAMLAMGNILFVVGISLFMGPKKTFSFFARKEKFRGTACFLLGVGLILAKYPLIGFFIELYGILNLFGDFFGVIIGVLGSVPVVGPYLEGPLRRITGATQQLPV
ncbi:Got1-domain-containing protein [Tuber magnatum]|uniref:Got1-domain-containing protein n=1 Tax=Tuber magnatum TaxID=42249 RepID=A0A317SPS0_9PEZI|nr:Got1-domain-containing protein [Tuber magnatum]